MYNTVRTVQQYNSKVVETEERWIPLNTHRHDRSLSWIGWFDFLVFNATFSNISAISWRPVLEVEEAGVPEENRRPWASNWQTLSLAAASREHPFGNLQRWVRTHVVLVIGLYELLDPTT